MSTEQHLPMPEFYLCRKIKGGVFSDREKIKQRILAIPPELREEVAKNYTTMFLDLGRNSANMYLTNYANKFVRSSS